MRPEAELKIVGGGAEETKLRDLATKMGIERSVSFAGLLADYPFRLVAESDICVSASEAESFGLAFVEAMCLGVPVVACDVGGIPEVVAHGETGLLVPPYSPEALANAIVTLASDPVLRQKMREASRLRARHYFDLADKVDAFINLLDNIRKGSSNYNSAFAGSGSETLREPTLPK
jgi:glycosyltransferase involved in cell wall biosynthesis